MDTPLFCSCQTWSALSNVRRVHSNSCCPSACYSAGCPPQCLCVNSVGTDGNNQKVQHRILHKKPHPPQKTTPRGCFWEFQTRRRIITRVTSNNTSPEVTPHTFTGPLLLSPGRYSICLGITHNIRTLCVRGNTPYGDLQYKRGGRTECRRQHLRSFDNCFDRSSASATDHLVLSTRANFFYTCGSSCYCYCSRCCCR